jgi:hypothetical protein
MSKGDFNNGDGGGESMRYGFDILTMNLRGGLDLGVLEVEKKPIV